MNALPRDAGSDASELLSQGIAASQAGQSNAAIECWLRASALVPGYAIPHFLIGSELASTGEVDRAEAALANAVRLDPRFLVARYQLGLLQFSAGRSALAVLTWEPLLEVDPLDPVSEPLSQFVKGHTALAQDDFSQALLYFEAGLAINDVNEPLSADVRLLVDRIHASMARQSPGAPQSGHSAPLPDEAVATHVLLSNYQAFGKPH
jgi:tetratricopeptide (TPR) repeat protein